MYTVTLIRGDGVGPEISEATLMVLDATGVKITWEEVIAGQEALEKHGTPLPESAVASIQKNGVGLKGPLTTPIGSGFRSVNVALRKELDLFVNLRPARSYPGVKSPFKDIDLVVVRENTEDLYAGVEHRVGRDAAESIKIITRYASERVVRFAFEYALKHNRKKVTAVHKANILKLSDGLFLETAREVAAHYPSVEFEDRIVDNMAMQLVQKPQRYDVLVMPNLYGDILSDLCAGLVGGLGMAPGANIGENTAVFEPVHGSAPKYSGANKVNPAAMILSAALMLEYLGEIEAAKRVQTALVSVLKEGRQVTYDLGGSAGTREMARAIADRVKAG
jgi:isocitrate dehydrogenase (NAD+)